MRAISPDRDDCEIRFPRVEGYRVELPSERLDAKFNDDSTLELTPELVGPTITRNEGIIGEGVDLSLVHTGDLRRSALLYNLTQRLLYTKWRDSGQEPKLHLFGQLKRITRRWLDEHLVCKGDTHPAQLMYQELADRACERITHGIVRNLAGDRPIKAVLDPYNPAGSTSQVNFSNFQEDSLANRPTPLPCQLDRLRQQLGEGVLPRRRGPSERPRLREKSGRRTGGALPPRIENTSLHPGLHCVSR